MKNNKLIASLVVFRELYDGNKDIYDIISEFIKASIALNKKWSFNSSEIASLLEKDFDFKIPVAVIKTVLRNRLTKASYVTHDNGEYHVVNICNSIDPEFESNLKEQNKVYKEIEKIFIAYIEGKENRELSNDEIEAIKNNLRQYLLGNGVDEPYNQPISECILLYQKNLDFQHKLNVVKEGLVLYTGVRYTSDLNELGRWSNELTIFLDTELLFFFAGYNGDVYRQIFMDFYTLVKEINQNSITRGGKKIIHLKYFEETEKEVLDFFHVAAHITEGRITLDPSKTAMKEIINGCHTKSDVLTKQNKFFIDLQTSGIHKEDERNYYADPSLVVEGESVIADVKKFAEERSKNFNEETCITYLKLFTKINVFRKGTNNQGFDRCKAILLTGNRFVQFMAYNRQIKLQENNTPFATDIDYITDKFWFKLKKGFGESNAKPRSFDVVTKAQIILSSQISNTVQEKYTALKQELDSGKLSKEEAISLVYELRESSLKPEEISANNVEESIKFINEFSIEDHIREREELKKKVEKGELAIIELKSRDRKDRSQQVQTLKTKVTNYAIGLKVAIVVGFMVSWFLLGYTTIKLLYSPQDTDLTVVSFIIGIIVLPAFPLFKYWNQLNIRIKTRALKMLKEALRPIFIK